MTRFRALTSSFEKATPILIMGALALISFSVLKSSPTQSSSPIPSHRVQFDYYLSQFSTAQLSPDGHLKSLARGRYAVHSLVTKNTIVQDFLFASSGKNNLYLGQAELADFDDDANKLILRQNAVVNRLPIKKNKHELGTTLKSNHLTYTQYPEKLTSEVAVQIEQGNRRIFANSMEYDSDEQRMRLLGNVKIKIERKLN
jgi:LPS export ABC transporter protein LptC